MHNKAAYARVMETGTKIGIFLACITLPLYISGLVVPCVAVSEIQEYWRLSPLEFSIKAGTTLGPGGWLKTIGTSDGLAALPILFFCILPIAAYGAMIATMIKNRDRVYTIMMIMEIVLIALAITGLV